MTWPVTVAILGTGSRGRTFANYAERFPDELKVVAVADPRIERRDALAERHAVPLNRRFVDWQELVGQDRLADAVLILTPDWEHAKPALRCAALGYHILMEKPIAPTEDECVEVVAAAEHTGAVFAICHVMRYTPYTSVMRRVIEEQRLGELVGIDQLEPVGWWHFAHSYVRGNWRRFDEVGPIILTKCCHDLDLMRYLLNRSPVQVSSHGGLHHFSSTNKPDGAADRCLDCSVEPTCPYSALRLYLGCLGDPKREKWPLGVVTTDLHDAGVREALRTGPYGRCVYSCDNDVPDHQVATVEFQGGLIGTLTMSAFTPASRRRTRIMGTRGFLEGDGEVLRVTDFLTGNTEELAVREPEAELNRRIGDGHDGGDDGVMRAFVHAVATGDRSQIRSDPRQSLESHLMAFAAERSRRTGQPVQIAAR